MYQPYRRNRDVRPFGSPWAYYGQQPTFQSYYGGGYHQPYWNYYNPQFSMQHYPTNYQGYPQYGQQNPYSTPYPTGMWQNQNPKATAGILNQFKKKDGTYDVNKMLDTAGQMMGAVNQVNSIVKGLTNTFKV